VVRVCLEGWRVLFHDCFFVLLAQRNVISLLHSQP
jgi:hypothetical protein